MNYPINLDIRDSYLSDLTSASITNWCLKDEIKIERLVGRGSYGKVYRVKRIGKLATTILAKKVTLGESRTLSNDFTREFGVLSKLSQSQTTKARDRLIKLIGIEISQSESGVWHTALYTPFYEHGNLDVYLQNVGCKLVKKDLKVMAKDILLILEQLRT